MCVKNLESAISEQEEVVESINFMLEESFVINKREYDEKTRAIAYDLKKNSNSFWFYFNWNDNSYLFIDANRKKVIEKGHYENSVMFQNMIIRMILYDS